MIDFGPPVPASTNDSVNAMIHNNPQLLGRLQQGSAGVIFYCELEWIVTINSIGDRCTTDDPRSVLHMLYLTSLSYRTISNLDNSE